MSLRTAEHSTGIQDNLNLLSSKCGFGEVHYRFDGGNAATATQVVSENSTLFRTLKKHEIILESVLKELCRIILRLGNTAMNRGLNEDVEISVDFDDSIIEDKAADFARDMQLLSAGHPQRLGVPCEVAQRGRGYGKGGAAEDAGFDDGKAGGD